MTVFKLPTIFILLLLSNAALATNYYVGANATGDGTGRDTNNLMTLSSANTTLQPGDTAFLLDNQGVYRTRIEPSRSGTSESNRISYRAYSGHKPTIDMGTTLTSWTKYSGTDGVDAIYRKQFQTGEGTLLVIDSFETAGDKAILWNVSNPNYGVKSDGSMVNRERSVCYSTSCMIYPGDHIYKDGYTYIRTYDNDNPNNHTINAIHQGNYGIVIKGKQYITVNGITIKYVQNFARISDSKYITIENNVFNYAFGYGGFSAFDTSYMVLRNNIIHGVGILQGHTADAIELYRVTYSMIEGNDIAYFGHQGIGMVDGKYSIIRKNKIHNGRAKNIQIKGWNSTNIVIEYNQSKDSPNADELITQHWADHAGIALAGSKNILRFNEFWANSTAITLTPIISAEEGFVSNHTRIYHNVAYGSRPTRAGENGGGLNFEHLNYVDTVVVNNIFAENFAGTKYGDRLPQGDAEPSQVGFGSLTTLHTLAPKIENNLFWTSGDTSKVFWKMSTSAFEAAYPNYAKNNVTGNPHFANYNINNPDWSLTSGSAAIDKGRFLTTTVGNYSGNTVKVKDARFFMDGFGITNGDQIKIGNHSLVTITNIDYSTNTITHNGNISGIDGHGVSFDYTGSAPDMGVAEFGGATSVAVAPPSPPTNLSIQITQ